jgi:hypothetical protein
MNYQRSPIIYSLALFMINVPTTIYAFNNINANNIPKWEMIAILIIMIALIRKKSRSVVIGVAIGLTIFYFTVKYIRIVLDI